jgi:hypothetical protein
MANDVAEAVARVEKAVRDIKLYYSRQYEGASPAQCVEWAALFESLLAALPTEPRVLQDAALRQDAERWRAMRPLLSGVDFGYGSPPHTVVLFQVPDDVRVGANADDIADALITRTGAAPDGD